MNEYTPTTDEIIRSFSIPPHRVIERTEGESFADYLSRLSIEGHGYQMESEAAAHRWLSEHDRQVAERAWDEGRDAVIRYSLKHVANEPEEIAGYIDQHIVGIGGSKLDNPYRKEQENNNA